MKRVIFRVLCFSGLWLSFLPSYSWSAGEAVQLPQPVLTGKLPVEKAIAQKKSVREFNDKPLTLAEISQLLWSANGNLPVDAVSGATTKVTPSAGGIYPLEVFLACGKGTVTGLAEGIYQYNPSSNSLQSMSEGDSRASLASACVSQMWMARAPVMIIIGAVFSRTTAKYGPYMGPRYVYMEAGNSNQNVLLQVESLGLHAATVGAFQDTTVAAAAKLPTGVTPLLIMAVGR